MKEYTSNKELDQIMKMLGSSSLLKGLSFETFDSTGIDIGNHYDIEMAASKMCKHLCLLGFTPVITYEAMENAAGNINLNDSLTIYININYKENYSTRQILAILAHELCHKFLYTHQIRYTGIYNELVTDCCAVYAGFGDIMLRGCEDVKIWGNTIKTKTIGYLSYSQYKYVNDLYCNKNKYDESSIVQDMIYADNESQTRPRHYTIKDLFYSKAFLMLICLFTLIIIGILIVIETVKAQ